GRTSRPRRGIRAGPAPGARRRRPRSGPRRSRGRSRSRRATRPAMRPWGRGYARHGRASIRPIGAAVARASCSSAGVLLYRTTPAFRTPDTQEDWMPQSAGLHERDDLLDDATKDRHRAAASLGEELEAVDWYDQRIVATKDAELKAILAHNRDEEKEHASMVLEWLRRHDSKFDEALREYLFVEGSVVGHEAEVEGAGGQDAPTGGASLGIGSLKGKGGL